MPDPVEARLQMLEHSLYDMHARLARTEDSYAYVNQRCNVLTESLMRCHQVCLPSGSSMFLYLLAAAVEL